MPTIITDPSGTKVIKRFRYDMVYHDGYMTVEDAREVASIFKGKGHYTYVFTPRKSRGVRGYPFNLWVSRYPVKRRTH